MYVAGTLQVAMFSSGLRKVRENVPPVKNVLGVQTRYG